MSIEVTYPGSVIIGSICPRVSFWNAFDTQRSRHNRLLIRERVKSQLQRENPLQQGARKATRLQGDSWLINLSRVDI